MKTLTLTCIAFFVGYQIGKSKKERKTTPVVKQEEPEAV